ncbi:hypothetical protein SprV_0902734200 [Sparganum proliferum]
MAKVRIKGKNGAFFDITSGVRQGCALSTYVTSWVFQLAVAAHVGVLCIKGLDYSVSELHDAFILFDVNHDGRITEAELNSVLNFLGIKSSPAEVKQMIAEADVDGNGTVEYDEFLRMMSRYSEKTSNYPDADMWEAFKVFDHNNDSVIDPDEIKRTMHFLGESVTDEEVQAMLLEADTDQDGLVNFEEFKQMMQLLRRPKKR